jgi:hypothetical protein
MRLWKLDFDGEQFFPVEISGTIEDAKTECQTSIARNRQYFRNQQDADDEAARKNEEYVPAFNKNDMFADHAFTMIKCQDCGKYFIFGVQEYEWYTARGYDLPKRCKDCRNARREKFKGGKSRNNR